MIYESNLNYFRSGVKPSVWRRWKAS